MFEAVWLVLFAFIPVVVVLAFIRGLYRALTDKSAAYGGPSYRGSIHNNPSKKS